MRLKLAAGHDRVAAVTKDACHGVHTRLDVDLTLQQQALLNCPVLHWFTMLHKHTGDYLSVLHLQRPCRSYQKLRDGVISHDHSHRQ